MGILQNYLFEKSLTPAELAKHNGSYLKILIKLIDDGVAVQVDPAHRATFGDTVVIDRGAIPALQAALKGAPLPKLVSARTSKGDAEISLSALFKGAAFTGLEGKKTYNAGHLAELFMGLAVTAKFFNLGQPTTPQQVMDMIGFITAGVSGKNYIFSITRQIDYPESGSKNDTLNFKAVVPAGSAEAFLEQARTRQFAPDLNAVFVSAIKYTNESVSVAESQQRVRQDPNNNHIDVISDGTTDATSTKADLTLKIDGTKVNLLSLKTYSSDTLGQISGTKFDALREWFKIGFNIDIEQRRNQFADNLTKEQKLKAVFTLYDEVIYPQFSDLIARQSPGTEAKIVEHLAKAANYYARGSSLENVEIVKLDDKIATGSYKILRFSDNLHEAMRHLDLDLKYIKGKTGKGRTIQIWIKPEADEKVADGANKLCQFRSQLMGGYLRNYFESGPMLEALTHIDTDVPGTELPGDSEVVSALRARRSTTQTPERQRRT